MPFEENKLPNWNLAGGLNELDPPSEVPPQDVIDVNNWKPEQDGKSRIKRPGYAKINAGFVSFGEPIRGIFKYVDPDGDEKIIIVTRDSVVVREDVWTWTRKLHDTDTFYNVDFRVPFLYQDKLCLLDQSAALDIEILETLDGATWTALDTDTPTIAPSVNHGMAAAVYADEIFYGLPGTNATDDLISRWDGSFNHELPSPHAGETVLHMHLWDGKLWILIYRSTGYLVYYYDGNSYSQIANYDAAAELPTNSIQILSGSIRNRMARFFTWNNILHLLVTTKDSVSGKWTWQILAFNPTLYDRFNEIYDQSGTDDDYGACSYFEHDGKAWIISQKLEYAGDADPVGNDNIIYSSPDLNTWTEENGSLVMGLITGEAVFGGKVFVSSLYNYATTRSYQIWTWDSIAKTFTSEMNITTNAAAAGHSHGDLIEFKANLYGAKYREVHKRELSTNTYTEIYTTSKEITQPVAAGALDDGRLVLALDEMVVIEGSTVYSLGLAAPVQAPTLAVDGNIIIDATNNKIDFEETAATPLVATLVNATYTPANLCGQIKAQLEAAGASTYTVTYETGNVFKILSDGAGGGGILNLLCFSGANAAVSTLAYLNFGSIDLTGALDYTASIGWALTGGYKYVQTYYRSGNYPVESNPSPESALIYPDGEKIDLSNLAVSPDPKVTHKRLYRVTADGETFFWIADLANATTTFEDKIDDDTCLGGDEVSYDRDPPPIGPYMEVWDNRLWIAGVEGYENYLYYTNLGTSEEMASTNFIPVKARESDKIKQIKAFGDKLIILKGSSYFRLSKVGASLYELEQLPGDIGTDAPWSVTVCDKFLIWHSDYGIEVFNGNSCYRGVNPPMPSDLIKRTLASINSEALDKIVGGHNFDDGEYWLSIPTGSNTEPDTLVNYNYMSRNIALYSFPEKLTYLMSTKTRLLGLMFLTGTEDGGVYIQGSGFDDDGAAISSHFQTGHFNVSAERDLYNVLRRLFIKYQLPANMTLTLEIYADFKKTKIATISLAGVTPTDNVELRNDIQHRQNLRIPGHYVSFKFINNEKTGGDVKVVGWNSYFTRKLKKFSVEAD